MTGALLRGGQIVVPYVPRRPAEAAALRYLGAGEVAEVAQALQSGSVILVGEVGVGKSRLADEVTVRQRIDPIARVDATPVTSGIRFAALVGLVPEVKGHEDWHEVRQRVDRLLQPRGGPPPIVRIDDLEFLDDDSAALVQHLVRSGKIRLLGTLRWRPALPDVVFTLWKEGLAVQIPVAGFDVDTTERFCQALLGGPVSAGLVAWVQRATQGNPALVGGLVRRAVEDGHLLIEDGLAVLADRPRLTHEVTHLARHRLDSLPGDARAALELVALAKALRWEALRALVGSDTVTRLESEGHLMVEADGPGLVVRLRDPWLTVLLAEALPRGRRADHHRALVEALRGEGPTPRECVQLACWLIEDGREVPAVELHRAAATACREGQVRIAEQLSATAMARDRGPRTLYLSAWSALIAGEPERALALLDQIQEPEARGEEVVLLRMAAAIRSGLDERELPEPYRAAAQVGLLANAGDYRAAHALAQDLPTGDADRAVGLIKTPLTWTLLQVGDGPSAFATAGRPPHPASAGEAVRHHFERWAAVRVHGMQQWHEVDEVVGPLLANAMEEGDRALAGSLTGYRGFLALQQGNLVSAEDLLIEARFHLGHHDPGGVLGLIEAWLVIVRAQRGRPDREVLASAERHLMQASGWLAQNSALVRARAWTAAASGDVAGAQEIARAGAEAAAHRAPLEEAMLLHETLRFGGRDPLVVERLDELADGSDLRAIGWRARYARAVLAGDAAGLMKFSGELEELGARLWAAEASADAALAFELAGDRRSARAARARGRLLLDGCPGVPATSLPGADGEPLTARQLEVARLAAACVSNAAIAAELHLSVRTVESHLFRAMKRLGVGRRDELAAVLPRDDLQ